MNRTNAHPRAARRAFTLLELLVVMGILLVLATLTVISVGKVTRDALLAAIKDITLGSSAIDLRYARTGSGDGKGAARGSANGGRSERQANGAVVKSYDITPKTS